MSKAKYQQIYQEIRRLIFEGVISPGDMLPSENDLAAQYHTSRVTIRKALSVLENENIVHSVHGKGCFVNEPEHERFTLIYNDRIAKFGSHIRYINLVRPDDELKEAMKLQPDQWVVSIMRTLHSTERASICDQVFMPYRKGMPLIEREIRFTEFHNFIYDKVSEYAVSTRMEIGFEQIRGEVAAFLALPEGSIVLVVYRFLLDEKGNVVTYGKQYLHPSYGRIVAYSGYRG